MKKCILVLIMFLATIILGVIEMTNVHKTLDTMNNIFTDLSQRYELNSEDITIFYEDIGDAKEIWESKEKWLCYLFNNRDLSTINDSINRLLAYTKNNDYDNAICELSLLREYNSKNYHIMGFNIGNVL